MDVTCVVQTGEGGGAVSSDRNSHLLRRQHLHWRVKGRQHMPAREGHLVDMLCPLVHSHACTSRHTQCFNPGVRLADLSSLSAPCPPPFPWCPLPSPPPHPFHSQPAPCMWLPVHGCQCRLHVPMSPRTAHSPPTRPWPSSPPPSVSPPPPTPPHSPPPPRVLLHVPPPHPSAASPSSLPAVPP